MTNEATTYEADAELQEEHIVGAAQRLCVIIREQAEHENRLVVSSGNQQRTIAKQAERIAELEQQLAARGAVDGNDSRWTELAANAIADFIAERFNRRQKIGETSQLFSSGEIRSIINQNAPPSPPTDPPGKRFDMEGYISESGNVLDIRERHGGKGVNWRPCTVIVHDAKPEPPEPEPEPFDFLAGIDELAELVQAKWDAESREITDRLKAEFKRLTAAAKGGG